MLGAWPTALGAVTHASSFVSRMQTPMVLVSLCAPITPMSILSLGLTLCNLHAPTLLLCRCFSMCSVACQTCCILSFPMLLFLLHLSWLMPSFPKQRTVSTFEYLGKEYRVLAVSAPRAASALKFLQHVPEIIEKKWSQQQFETVWEQLKLFVRHGSPEGCKTFRIACEYRGSKLVRAVQSRVHFFYWEISLQRFKSMSSIQQGIATVEFAKNVFQQLDAISAIDKIVPLEHLSCCLEKDDSELYNGKCWECFVKSPGAGLQRRCLHQAFGGVRTCFKGLIRLLLGPYKAILQSPIRAFRVLEAFGC